MNSTFATALKAKREAMGLTQTELAVILKVDQSAVSRWESGATAPMMLIQECVWIKLEKYND